MSKKQTEQTSGPVLPVIQLSLEQIYVDEKNNMRRFPAPAATVQAMANSIKEFGLLSPLIVTPVEENGNGNGSGSVPHGMTHVLRAGFRRYRALQLLAETGEMVVDQVNAIIADRKPGWMTNVEENKERQELSLIDFAYAIKDRTDAGDSKADVSRDLGKTKAWVSYVAPLVGLRPEIQKKIHAGDIPFRLARELPMLEEKDQDDRIAKLEAGMGVTEVAEESARKRGKRGKGGRKSKEESSTGRGISAKQALNTFEEAVEELKGQEKLTKAEEKRLTLYQALAKFMAGGLGAKALDNRLAELL